MKTVKLNKANEVTFFLNNIKCQDKRILKLTKEQNQKEVFQAINNHKIVREQPIGRTAGQTKYMKNIKRGWKKRLPEGYKPKVLVSTAI